MLKLIGNDIWRGENKIGYVEGHHIIDHNGKKLGYFTDHHVWNMNDDKIAYIEEDHLFTESGKSKILLENVAETIEGGVLPIIGKCAIYILLGA
jgi:hypothetical protein